MLENVEFLGHSSLKIKGDKTIYIDPFNIKEKYQDADIIFITHSHYDHFSIEDIQKIKKEDTKIVITEDLKDKVIGFKEILIIKPNQNYEIVNIKFKTIPSYNIDKPFHPKENNFVGYIIEINNYTYFIAGDTDITEENKKVKCDVAFLPIGGKYTMNYEEAAILANEINPKIVVPIHYGSIVGNMEDALKFKEKTKIKCEIMQS